MPNDAPSGWRRTSMREVVSFFSSGEPFLKLEYSDFGIPVLAKGDVKPFGRLEHGEKRYISQTLMQSRVFRLTQPGDYLLTTRDLTQDADFLGLLARIPEDRSYLVNQGANIIRFVPEVSGRFIVYWCNGPIYRAYIKGHYVGSTQIHLRKEDFFDAPLWLPDGRDQIHIASVLGALDDKIDLNRKMNETLEAMARALFKSWFVDFDPVRAKAEGRDTRLSTSLAALFPDSLEESSLGEIPASWTVEPIGNLTEVIGGTTPSTKEPGFWTPDIHAWATPKDLSSLQTPVLLRTERQISDKGLTQIGSGLLSVGTVLLSSRAPIGYLAVAEIPVAINQGFIAMKPRAGVSNLFLLYWAEVAQDTIKSRANGSTFLEISKSNFRQIDMVRPDEAVMKEFDAYVRPWYERIVANEREIANLVTIRDALLPKLITGEIRAGQVKEEG